MIDLRSDTVTKQSDKMRSAMAQADVGEDDTRPRHVFHASAGIGDRLGDNFESAPGLSVDITGRGRATGRGNWGGAANNDVVTDAHGTGKADHWLEVGAGAHQLTFRHDVSLVKADDDRHVV